MGKKRRFCPKCEEEMRFRLGQYECPNCFYVLDLREDKPIKSKYRTSTSRLEDTLRGMPDYRESGDPWSPT